MKKKSHFTNNIIYRISVGKILQGKEEWEENLIF
jgi:hypothetical protein